MAFYSPEYNDSVLLVSDVSCWNQGRRHTVPVLLHFTINRSQQAGYVLNMYFDEYEIIRITPYSPISLVYEYFLKYMYVHEYKVDLNRVMRI
jgi:hypothetical protein